jgi:AcrR family transcriptional regulator
MYRENETSVVVARVKKQSEVRRGEFLDAALALFLEHGYDATTINDVIARVGVSKGAFYHHYRAKDDLLEGLALRFGTQGLDAVADILSQGELNALEKMNAFFARTRQIKVETAPVVWSTFKALFRPENLVLYHRIRVALSEVMTPVLTGLIKEGMEEGVFDTPDAHGTALMLMQINAVTHDAIARIVATEGTEALAAALDDLERLMEVQGIGVDRLLGLPDGTIKLSEPGFAKAIMSGTS